MSAADAGDLSARFTAAAERHGGVFGRDAVKSLMAEAWAEGAVVAWEASGEGWNGEYPGEPFTNNEIPNPYRDRP